MLLAVAAGVAVSTIYFAQPLLVAMGESFGISPSKVGLFVTATQVGYGVGLFLLVPLGDLVNRRRLVVLQFALLATTLLAIGTARTTPLVLIGLAATGLLAVVTQSLLAFAASLAGPAQRGRAIGGVTSGVVIGILLARTAAGVLADLAGWRTVYLASAGLSLALALALHQRLPTRDRRELTLGYGALVRSTLTLFREERVFRERAVLAMLIFAAFSTLWSSLALPLNHLSHTAVGAFGLAGVAGALAAGPAGRLNDRGLSRRTTGTALGVLAISWIPLAYTTRSLWALVIGAVLLDLAVQAVHVTNQSLIYELRPDAGSRLIGGYMVFYSAGSGLGAAGSTAIYDVAGWPAVCLLGLAFSLLALLVWAFDSK